MALAHTKKLCNDILVESIGSPHLIEAANDSYLQGVQLVLCNLFSALVSTVSKFVGHVLFLCLPRQIGERVIGTTASTVTGVHAFWPWANECG